MRNSLVILFLMVFALPAVQAQETGDYDYKREFIWGGTKATNSGLIGGLILRYGMKLDERKYHHVALEAVNIKHPQERRDFRSTGTFIRGKINYLYSVRLMYGREWMMFKKAPQQGVQISGIIAAGPSIGLEAPYYVSYSTDQGIVKVQYHPDLYEEYIRSSTAILQSIGNSKLVPGINAKSSLSFEFGAFKSNVVGVETGFMLEAYSRGITILANEQNPRMFTRSVFPNAFVTLYYGTRL